MRIQSADLDEEIPPALNRFKSAKTDVVTRGKEGNSYFMQGLSFGAALVGTAGCIFANSNKVEQNFIGQALLHTAQNALAIGTLASAVYHVASVDIGNYFGNLRHAAKETFFGQGISAAGAVLGAAGCIALNAAKVENNFTDKDFLENAQHVLAATTLASSALMIGYPQVKQTVKNVFGK